MSQSLASDVPAPPIGRAIEAVPSTKLVPPRAARRLVPRDALQERLLAARGQRCVIVQGPAGSGKTSTLVAWRQGLLTLDFDVAWLTVATEDNELARFFGSLLASIGPRHRAEGGPGSGGAHRCAAGSYRRVAGRRVEGGG